MAYDYIFGGAPYPPSPGLSPSLGVDTVNHTQLSPDGSGGWSGRLKKKMVALSASGAIAPRQGQSYVITKAGVAALTLAAPTAGADDGTIIEITSGTAFAHTLTATGLFNTGSTNVNLATLAAFAGATLVLMAYNGKWNVVSQIGITFS
jgi:hypothetical protein